MSLIIHVRNGKKKKKKKKKKKITDIKCFCFRNTSIRVTSLKFDRYVWLLCPTFHRLGTVPVPGLHDRLG
jgi:hypothetical protein